MNIIIVDAHPITLDAYYNHFESNFYLKNIVIYKAKSCFEAYNIILEKKNNKDFFQLAIVDYNLPPYFDQNLYNGGDIVLLIKSLFDQSHTLLLTAHTETLIIYQILRKVNPSGIAIKSDINLELFDEIILKLLRGEIYKSLSVKECIDKIWNYDLICEEYNRQIIFYLSKGYKVKELHSVITLTSSAINKRLLRLKKLFQVKDERELIKALYAENFI